MMNHDVSIGANGAKPVPEIMENELVVTWMLIKTETLFI
jgi:hypothetical protein